MRDADFIIVGAGSAGCVLASEICRRELGTVILTESGPLPSSRHLKVPSEYPLAFQGPHAWRHSTAPQPRLANRRLNLPAGKTLGGSSALNALIYLRGHPADFDRWEQAAGSGWSRHQVSRAFEAMEASMQIEQMETPELHPALDSFLTKDSQAASLGNAKSHRVLVEPALGLGAYRRLQSCGRRRSAWDLWMKKKGATEDDSQIGLRGIEILTGASVQRIVFTGARATGVSISHRESPRVESQLHARKGVIVCAGAIRSPQLLLASGIGDADELAEIGIECRVHSTSVGKNFQDHLVFPVVCALKRHESLAFPMSHSDRLLYAKNRTGPRASNIAEAGGFFSLPSKRSLAGELDFQWHITPTHYLEYPNKAEPTAAMSFAVGVSRPSSRGSIRLRLATASDSPERFTTEVEPGYLSAPDDLEQMFEAIQWTRSYVQNECFSELLRGELLPGPKRQSREQLIGAIERLATTIYHYAGTCMMGPASRGVVDSRFRVHSTEGLWVCDASAMPTLVTGNTQATVMMMAFRLAEWLGE